MNIKSTTVKPSAASTKLSVAEARIAELEAQLAAKPTAGRQNNHSTDYLVSAEDIKSIGYAKLVELRDGCKIIDKSDSSGFKMRPTKTGGKAFVMAEGVDYAWYNVVKDFAAQLKPVTPLSDKQFVVLQGVLSDMIRGGVLEA